VTHTHADDWRALDAVVRPEDPQPEGWYAIALAEELGPRGPIGCDFLGGRVVVYRDREGGLAALDARCPHMGADLSLGDVVDGEIRCTYHHFRFGGDGRCTAIPSDGPIPAAARVAAHACVEHLGLLWLYHGARPRFDPPAVRDFAPDDLVYRARRTNVFSVAPWLSIGNTFDFMHLRYVHGLDFEITPDDVRYVDDHHIELEIPFVSPETGPFEQRIRVTGTNAVSFLTVTDHTTVGLFTSTPVGDRSQSFYVAAVPKDPDASPAEMEKRLAEQEAFGDGLLADDARTLTGIRFQVGTLVGEDRAMVRYMKWVSAFARAPSSPSAAAARPTGSPRSPR